MQHKNVSGELQISINGQKLENVTHATYIGVVVDQHLQWQHQVNHLCKKVSPKFYLLRRLSKILPKNILSKIYFSCIQPHIDYGCTVWGNTSVLNMQNVQRLQNTAARIILKQYDYINYRGSDLVKELGWKNFNDRCNFLTAKLMFKCLHGKAPHYLEDNIDMLCDIMPFNSRSKYTMDLLIPHHNSEQFKTSFRYRGATIWNSLPECVKECSSQLSFKYNS